MRFSLLATVSVSFLLSTFTTLVSAKCSLETADVDKYHNCVQEKFGTCTPDNSPCLCEYYKGALDCVKDWCGADWNKDEYSGIYYDGIKTHCGGAGSVPSTTAAPGTTAITAAVATTTAAAAGTTTGAATGTGTITAAASAKTNAAGKLGAGLVGIVGAVGVAAAIL